ncbi:unnamed protein product [Sphenostylis stenocarpa]|uniref:RIN4 pathogenic type III effector avirulence factor Avr cleavage site domain-containing protein n=1 Tax=Sphenostylis stenocarpa TaxID=92480 RepID=A0AA86SZS6_9FABA|nr:unnamed protein product [Sphenostylis stenocarpa]
MGMVVVISLPFIIFCFLLGFGCYFFGRARGRKEVQTNPQVYGMPAPPPGASFPSPPPSHSHSKPDNALNEKGRPLPKFGEWDVNDPSSGSDFSVIFTKASNETKSGSKAQLPSKPKPQRNLQISLCKPRFDDNFALPGLSIIPGNLELH